MFSIKKYLLISAWLMLAVLGFEPLMAQQKMIGVNVDVYTFIDSTNRLNHESVYSRKASLGFIKEAKPGLSLSKANNGKNAWQFLSIVNETDAEKEFHVINTHPFLDDYRLYYFQDQKLIDSSVFIYKEKVSANFIWPSNTPTAKVKVQARSNVDVLIKVMNQYGKLNYNLAIHDKSSFYLHLLVTHFVYFGFLGISTVIVLISLSFYFISRSKIYLIYAGYIFFVCLGFNSIVGNLYQFSTHAIDFLNGETSFRFYIYSGLICDIFFLRKLFETKKSDRTYLFITNICLFLCGLGIVLATVNGSFYYKISPIIAPEIQFIFIALFTIVYYFKKRQTTRNLFILSFTPIMLLLLYRSLIFLGFVSSPLIFSFYFVLGLVFEFIILLIGMSVAFVKRLYAQEALEKQIITEQIRTQESERRKIAQDLHDDLGSTLAILKDKINASSDESSSESGQLIEKAINDLRTISHHLLPTDFEHFGMVPSIERYVAKLNDGGLKITWILFGGIRTFDNAKALNIYRIVVEILHNFKKHSPDSTATFQMIFREKELFVSFENNVRSNMNTSKGMGIGQKSISSRLQYLNAKQIEFGSEANGYSYAFEIPYE